MALWFPNRANGNDRQKEPVIQRLPTLLVIALLLQACASRPDPRFANFPEPQRSWVSKELRERPDSQFSRAYRGEPDALHATFHRVMEPDLDGGESEGFLFNIIAIRGALGDERFFSALSKESPEIQRRMKDFAPLQ